MSSSSYIRIVGSYRSRSKPPITLPRKNNSVTTNLAHWHVCSSGSRWDTNSPPPPPASHLIDYVSVFISHNLVLYQNPPKKKGLREHDRASKAPKLGLSASRSWCVINFATPPPPPPIENPGFDHALQPRIAS